MKKYLIRLITAVVMLLLGFGAGGIYYGFIKVNPAVKESLEKRIIAHLRIQSYNEGQYTVKIIKGLKFDGMRDYHADVEFKDEPSHHYYYGEGEEGKLIQDGWNGTKHIGSARE